MKVKWLGHASFLVTSDDGKRIITDPYEPGFRGLINYDKIEEAAHFIKDRPSVAVLEDSQVELRAEALPAATQVVVLRHAL